jgi:hypothetical protein
MVHLAIEYVLDDWVQNIVVMEAQLLMLFVITILNRITTWEIRQLSFLVTRNDK